MGFRYELRRDGERLALFVSLSDAIKFFKFDSMYPVYHDSVYKVIDRDKGAFWTLESKSF